jgi:hypothetical protein
MAFRLEGIVQSGMTEAEPTTAWSPAMIRASALFDRREVVINLTRDNA